MSGATRLQLGFRPRASQQDRFGGVTKMHALARSLSLLMLFRDALGFGAVAMPCTVPEAPSDIATACSTASTECGLACALATNCNLTECSTDPRCAPYASCSILPPVIACLSTIPEAPADIATTCSTASVACGTACQGATNCNLAECSTDLRCAPYAYCSIIG